MQGTTVPAITYGAQTWSLTRNQEEKLGVVQRNIEGKIAAIGWEQKISNEKLKEITEGRDIGYITKKLKLSYAEHVAREKEQKWGGGVLLNWIPRYNMRQKGRPAKRWEDETKKEMRPTWKRRAQDRKHWKNDVEVYAQQ